MGEREREREREMLKNLSRRVQAEMGGGADDGWGKIMKLAKGVTLNLGTSRSIDEKRNDDDQLAHCTGQGFPDFVPSTYFILQFQSLTHSLNHTHTQKS